MHSMEVGSRALREVEFRQQLRGYHQDDVDKFLEEVAAGIEVLQDQVRQANERAARAEAGLHRAGGPPRDEDLDEDAVRRTLVLAQRTAGMAIREAKEEASRMVAEAEARARELIAAAEEAADRRIAEARNELRSEVTRLTAARAELAGQVAALQDQVEEGRRRARDSLERALSLIDEARPRLTPGPRDAGEAGFRSENGSLHPGNETAPGRVPPDATVLAPAALPATQPKEAGPIPKDGGAHTGTDPEPVPGKGPVPATGPFDHDLDDPAATRLLRLEPDRASLEHYGRSRVFDAEQFDS